MHQHNAYLSILFREFPEAASQTFEDGWPCKLVNGLVTEWVSVSDAFLACFAAQDASGTTSQACQVVLAEPSFIVVEGNLLDTSAADEVLAAADLGVEKELAKDSNLLGTGLAGWYIRDQTSAPAVRIQSFRNSYPSPTVEPSASEVGDTNARVRGRLIDAICLWNNADA
jgi:hypothetical protein